MRHDLFDGETTLGYGLEHAGDELFGVERDVEPLGRRELELTAEYAGLHARRHGLAVRAVEGRIAAAQYVHDHAQRPDVARDVVLLEAEDLGRHVVRREAFFVFINKMFKFYSSKLINSKIIEFYNQS